MKLRKRWIFIIPALVLAFFAGACAPKPFLKVQYQVPSPSSILEGEKGYPGCFRYEGKEDLINRKRQNVLEKL